MIPEEKIEEILSKADIEELFKNQGVTLKGTASLKCSCPFHTEKTPSCVVKPSTGLWHCFGCGKGGNAISFVMERDGLGFRDAAKVLARELHIDLEEDYHQPTEEQRLHHLKREGMLVALQVCHRFFIEQLYLNNADAAEARKYANDRWGEKFVKQSDIGYAPNSWDALIQYAEHNCVSKELLIELGIIVPNKPKEDAQNAEKAQQNPEPVKYHDQFRGRIMIPIHSNTGQVIGFTGRILPKFENDRTPKYINSTNSLIYRKENTLFGLHVAGRVARTENRVFLCEGAPDVLRLQTLDIYNAVACLGSSWTEDQLALLKKHTRNITFIPDADPIKPTEKNTEKFGTGVRKVIEYAQVAFKMGFYVRIKEIPLGSKGEKQDADSFFKTRAMFTDHKEEDFISWYALKLQAAYPDNDLQHVNTLAELLTYLQAEDEIKYFKAAINKVFHQAQPLNDALAKIKKEKTLKKITKSANPKIDYQEWGFTETENHYYGNTAYGMADWSNFILQPLFHVKSSLSSMRLYRITNKHNQSQLVEFKQEEMGSLDKFCNKTESLGNYVWLAKMEQLKKLKLYLYATTESADLITQLGWQRQGFYAFGNGVIYQGQWLFADQLGIVRINSIGNFYLPAFSEIYQNDDQLYQFERSFVHLNQCAISLYDYVELLSDTFGENGIIAFCFYLATLFKDFVVRETKVFPILYLFGPKGSGKSELGHTIMSFFIIGNIPPNLMNSTLPALSDSVAQVANACVHIDEYKNIITLDKREFLKGIWDCVGRTRMNMDRDKKREVTRVDAGVIVSGQEMPTIDPALFTRVILLKYEKSEFTVEQQRLFTKLKEIRKLGVSHLTMELLKYRPQFEANFRTCYREIADKFGDELGDMVEKRIMDNWLVPLSAFKALHNYLRLPFTYEQLEQLIRQGIMAQNDESKQIDELSNFWNAINMVYHKGELENGVDFRLEYVDRVILNIDKTQTAEHRFKKPTHIILVRFKLLYPIYRKFEIDQRVEPLPQNSLLLYLKASRAYVGWKKSVSFRASSKVADSYVQSVENGATIVQKKRDITDALVFDYDLLADLYELTLRQLHPNTPVPDEGFDNSTSSSEESSVDPELF